jgi:hypothetical protein
MEYANLLLSMTVLALAFVLARIILPRPGSSANRLAVIVATEKLTAVSRAIDEALARNKINSQSTSSIKKRLTMDPIFVALTEGVTELTSKIDSLIQHDTNLFQLLEEALAKPTPPEVVAAVQAIIDTEKTYKDKIDAAIVANTHGTA